MNLLSSRTKVFLLAGVVYGFFWVLFSCGKKKSTEPKPVGPTIDFNAEILPILQTRCNTSGCHGGQTAADTAGGLVFSSFETMRQTVGQRTSWTKPLIIPGNPDSSHLLLTIRQSRPSVMPPAPLPPLPQSEIDKVSNWIKQGARGPGGKKFPTFREGKLYVANSADGRVDVVDLSMNYKVDTIATTFPGESPTIVQTHHIAVSPDKKFIYVTNAWAFGHILKIDTGTDSVLTRVRAGYQPADIVVSPDGQYVYTTDYTIGLNVTSVVRQFNAQILALTDTFPIGKAPHGIAINKDGTEVLAAGQISDDCWLIYPNINPLLDSSYRVKLSPGISNNYPNIDTSFYGPFGVVLSKNDSLAYISCIDSAATLHNHQIRIVDIKVRGVVDSIVLDQISGNNPLMMAIDSLGQVLYVACLESNKLAIIDLPSKSISYISVGYRPHAPVLAINKGLLYITCEGDHKKPYLVYVVNTITKMVIDSIEVGRFPNGIAIIEP